MLFLIFFFFFNDTATTEIYTLSLHDALPICFVWVGDGELRPAVEAAIRRAGLEDRIRLAGWRQDIPRVMRSEEHTSELQSRLHLVCRLLLEKKKKKNNPVAPQSQATECALVD